MNGSKLGDEYYLEVLWWVKIVVGLRSLEFKCGCDDRLMFEWWYFNVFKFVIYINLRFVRYKSCDIFYMLF